jgi:hypothetical protein
MEHECSLPHSRASPPVPVLSQIIPVHAPIQLLEDHFNIILISTSSSQWSLLITSPGTGTGFSPPTPVYPWQIIPPLLHLSLQFYSWQVTQMASGFWSTGAWCCVEGCLALASEGRTGLGIRQTVVRGLEDGVMLPAKRGAQQRESC